MENNAVKVYIRLLNEGTEASRPTEALELGNGLFKILATADYDQEDESWEFVPGSTVACKKIIDGSEEYLLAIKQYEI